MNSKLDIILCVFVLPGMMLLFPVLEWSQWHPGYVLGYALWLYAVYFLCRLLLGPMLAKGNYWMLAGTLFLVATVTFLMSLAPVDIPRVDGTMQPHVRAMWVLLTATVAIALPSSYLEYRLKLALMAEEQSQARDNARALQEIGVESLGYASLDIKAGYKTVHIPLVAVLYIESRNNYSCIHLDNADDVVPQIPLKNLLAMLPEGKFVRVHRSYVVPLWRIEKSSATRIQLMGVSEPIPVGRAFKK